MYFFCPALGGPCWPNDSRQVFGTSRLAFVFEAPSNFFYSWRFGPNKQITDQIILPQNTHILSIWFRNKRLFYNTATSFAFNSPIWRAGLIIATTGCNFFFFFLFSSSLSFLRNVSDENLHFILQGASNEGQSVRPLAVNMFARQKTQFCVH